MHKEVPPPRSWKPLVIRHQAFVARVYVSADKQTLSSKSCVQRPGMHDMGAISGYRSSRATSNVTTGSVSNASFGTADQSQQHQQQQDDAGSKPPQKGSAPTEGQAGVPAQSNGNIKQEQQQQPMEGVELQQPHQHSHQQQHPNGQSGIAQQQPQQQQGDSDDMLLIAAVPSQEAPALIGMDGAAGVGLLGGIGPTPMQTG